MRTLLIPALGILVLATGCTSAQPQTAQATAPSTGNEAPNDVPSTATSAVTDEVVATADLEAAEESQAAAFAPAVAADERDDAGPIARQAAKPVVGDGDAGIPPVWLSAGHARFCQVNVGEVFPTIELPQQSGEAATLDALAGARATVVLFWTNDAWMSAMALQDLARIADSDDVAVVGVAVKVPADEAQKRLADAGAKFPQLVDAEGTAFAQVGAVALPRIFVLDAQRRIAWFDVEYSEATYRELHQTLAALIAVK
jgi:peroxiredoxin